MDPIELTEKLSGNIGKPCHVILKDGTEYNGIYTGTNHDGFGVINMNLGKIIKDASFGHPEIQSIEFSD